MTLYGNIVYQYRLLNEKFGIDTIALVTGCSICGQQTYHWGSLFPAWYSFTPPQRPNFAPPLTPDRLPIDSRPGPVLKVMPINYS